MGEKAHNEKPLKQCTNKACASHGTKVRTDAEKCLLCNRDLSSAGGLEDLLGDLGGFGDFFGRKR